MASLSILAAAVTLLAVFANLSVLHGEDSREGFDGEGPLGLR